MYDTKKITSNNLRPVGQMNSAVPVSRFNNILSLSTFFVIGLQKTEGWKTSLITKNCVVTKRFDNKMIQFLCIAVYTLYLSYPVWNTGVIVVEMCSE